MDFRKKITTKDIFLIFIAGLLGMILTAVLIGSFSLVYREEIFQYFTKENSKETNVKFGSQEALVIKAAKNANPAVVSIVISKEVPKYEIYVDPEGQNFFRDFFGIDYFFPQYEYRLKGTEKKEVGGGSGFLVSDDGLIVTNKHVVDQKDVEYTVFTNDGKKHIAKVIDRDPVLDIAIIKINGSGFPCLALGDSGKLEVGQSVIAIGNALGEFRNTVSLGVVSGLARSIIAGDETGRAEVLKQVIQTDAAINRGNSGGPLLDLEGKVVGVNVAIAEGSQNIGFALPVNSIKGAIDSVKATGKIILPQEANN